MSDTTKAATNMVEILDKIVDLTASGVQLTIQKLQEHAPQAWEIVRARVQAEAIVGVWTSVFLIILGGLLLGVLMPFSWRKTDGNDRWVFVVVMSMIAGIILPIVGIVNGVGNLIDLNSLEYATAARILEMIK